MADLLERFRSSPLRLPRSAQESEGPGALANLVAPVISDLAMALREVEDDTEIGPGSPALREVEKGITFVGASLAGHGAPSFDAAALAVCLRQAFLVRVTSESERELVWQLSDWLAALLSEGYAMAAAAAAREQFRERLEAATPVVLVRPELPVAFLIGDAGVHAVDGVLGRLLMQIARVGAETVVIDAAGLADAAELGVLEALRRFLGHDKVAGKRSLVAIGVAGQAEAEWKRIAGAAGVPISFADSLLAAIAQAKHE